jgi:vacuolar-type H+-ATPase subunit E/Vma4
MALSDIQKKITSDAEKKKEQIITEAATVASGITLETEEKKDALSANATQEIEKAKQSMERITLSEADQKVRSAIARAREKKINEAFKSSLESLQKLSNEDYTALIKEKISSINMDEIDSIETSQDRLEILKKALGSAQVEVMVNDSISGGFIASGKKVHYDFSFENLLKNAREALTVEVSKTLFKN